MNSPKHIVSAEPQPVLFNDPKDLDFGEVWTTGRLVWPLKLLNQSQSEATLDNLSGNCSTCQASARARWLDREAQSLLPVEYFHVVFTLPAEIAELALATGRRCTSCCSPRRRRR